MISRLQVKLLRISTGFFYFVVVSFVILVFLPFLRLKIEGKENIPTRGRFILAANHKNFFDGFFLAYATGPHRVAHFVIAKRALNLRFWQLLAWLIGSVEIGDDIEDYQRALKKLNRILTHGGIVGIFPEGDISRSELPRKFKGGVAKLSLDSRTKVLPVYISGTYNLRHFSYWLSRPKITLRFGKPVELYNLAPTYNQNLDQMASLLREKVIELMDVKVMESKIKSIAEIPLEKTVLKV